MNQTIGVLIPTYNRLKLLKRCLESVYSQIYEHYHIFIYDDFSGEDTREFLKNLDKRFHTVIHGKENLGVAHARNELLKSCDTEIACWLDDDDVMNIYRLQNQYEAIKDNPDSYAIGNARIFRENQKIDITELNFSTQKENAFASMMFWNKDLPRFDESIGNNGGEDTGWIKQLKQKRIELPGINYYIYMHDNRIGIRKLNGKNK